MKIIPSNIKKIISILILILVMVYPFRITAQVEKLHKEKYTIYIEEKENRIKANVLAHKTKVKTKPYLTYRWYSSNKIMDTQGGYEGKLLHGEYVSFYQSNNNLKEKGKFKKGLKQGFWNSWNENGKISRISRWKNGQLNGRYKTYDNNGSLLSEKRYKKDKEVKLRKTISECIKAVFKFKKKEKKKPILAS